MTSVRQRDLKARYQSVIDAGGPVVVLQPIVELATGRRVGVEALSRFPAEWNQSPDACFAEAHSAGMGNALEVLTLARAGEYLATIRGYLAINVSAAVLLTPECNAVLSELALERVVLELSEHDLVEDYAELTARLAPLRAAGMSLATDDVGAAFSSLRHIVLTAPDLIKIDRGLVTGLATDATRLALVESLVALGHGYDCQIVAVGVETEQDAAMLTELGVDAGQGWLFGRPGPAGDLAEALPAAPASSLPEPRSTTTPPMGVAGQLTPNRLWGHQAWLHHRHSRPEH